MKTPVTSRALRQHLTYSWWKYLLIVLLVFGGVDLLFTATAYKPPEEKKIELYVYGLVNETSMNEYLENVRQKEMPDMESLACVTMMDDATYGPMQLMTYLAAREGDLYLLPREQFISVATTDALVPLEDDAELMALFDSEGISLQSGWRKNTETGETHLYGIPQSKLPGLSQYAWVNDGYLCVIVMNGNDDNAMKFMRILCRDMLTAPEPESVPEAESASEATATESADASPAP